jgi:RNA polymerase-binding transcription factor DksA
MMGAMREWPTDRSELRRALEARRAELDAMVQLRVARIREHGADPSETRYEEEDPSHDLDAAIADLATATLRHIDQALQRLGNGEYGRCSSCGGRIAEVRLRALPFALRCRGCESAREADATAIRSQRQRLQPDTDGLRATRPDDMH